MLLREYPDRYVIEYGVLTGTKLHESLPKYAFLKELGAFKGAGGGVQPEFKEGLSDQQLSAAKKALEVSMSSAALTCDSTFLLVVSVGA